MSKLYTVILSVYTQGREEQVVPDYKYRKTFYNMRTMSFYPDILHEETDINP